MTTADHTRRGKGIDYIILSFVLWLIVEYITVWRSRLDEWIELFPGVLIQYLVIILTFWYLAFRRRWRERSILLFMFALMYSLELLWQNHLLFNPFTFVPGSLLLMSIWGFLTFMPLWLTQHTLRDRKPQALACLIWMPLGFVLAIFWG